MEQRQENLLACFQKAIRNPNFVERLAQKLESMDFSAYTKKRRLPQAENSQPVEETILVDNHSSSRLEFGNLSHQDFSNKLRLELSPAVSDGNLLSHSTQSSNEDGGSPHRRLSEGWPNDLQMKTADGLYAPETVELSDTGTSFTLKMDSSLTGKASVVASPRLNSFQHSLTTNEEVDGQMSCHLNLTLASSTLQVDSNPHSARMPQMGDIIRCSEARSNIDGNVADHSIPQKTRNPSIDNANLSSAHSASSNKQGPAPPPARVNDVFWEQFLTERPGCTDNEEASSSFRASSYDEQEDRRSNQGIARNTSNMDKLTL